MALEHNDIDVEDFLKDTAQKEKHKEKVLIIGKSKRYFFDYFSLKALPIYDEVKMLDQKAVTYLVIHSKKNKIKSISTNFPFMGSFPYLGFFSKDSATQYKEKLEKENFQTYMRPVYAYSTLNNSYWPFHDNILSSFFYFKEKDLTRLVFHELVHTIIFVGSNVGFNENLAQFISRKMAIEYFKYSNKELTFELLQDSRNKLLNKAIVESAVKLNNRYKSEKTDFDKIGIDFIKSDFLPHMRNTCKILKMKSCWPLSGEWNNARFAAFKTYEAKQNQIELLFKQVNLPLKEFVLWLIKEEKSFNGKNDFISFLKNRIKK